MLIKFSDGITTEGIGNQTPRISFRLLIKSWSGYNVGPNLKTRDLIETK